MEQLGDVGFLVSKRKTTDKRGNSMQRPDRPHRERRPWPPPSARFALQTTAVAAESGPCLEPASHPAHGKSPLADRRGKPTPPYRCLSLGSARFSMQRDSWQAHPDANRGGTISPSCRSCQQRSLTNAECKGREPELEKELQKGVAAPFQKPFAEDAKIDRAVFSCSYSKL